MTKEQKVTRGDKYLVGYGVATLKKLRKKETNKKASDLSRRPYFGRGTAPSIQ